MHQMYLGQWAIFDRDVIDTVNTVAAECQRIIGKRMLRELCLEAPNFAVLTYHYHLFITADSVLCLWQAVIIIP
jgi:hypothetical protein